MLVIDCHAHIYSPDEKRYPVRKDPLRPPPGKGSVEHLRQMLESPTLENCFAQLVVQEDTVKTAADMVAVIRG